ncbi:MAG: NAD(P)-dependent oxidoreductase [Firmicutes bacterium]|nr:NAD(P)-dependent oxidoreductase [Bacillota bacterium]
MRIALIGTGYLGSVVARRLPRGLDLWLFNRHPERAQGLAREVGATASSDLYLAGTADVVLLALPPDAVTPVAEQIGALVPPGAVIVSLATGSLLEEWMGRLPFGPIAVSAKVVGSVVEMELGEPALIFLFSEDLGAATKVAPLLAGLGPVRIGEVEEERTVQAVNLLAAEEAARALLQIRKRLAELGPPGELPEVWEALAAQIGSGCLKAFSRGHVGPFGRKILEKVGMAAGGGQDGHQG